MQTLIRLVFSAGLALSLSLTSETDAQQTVQALAQKASEEWLALVDAGRYGESWDAASEGFKAAVSREKWLTQLNGTRPALGRVISRKLAKSDYMKNPPEVPAGEYVAIRYRSSFAKMESAVELVIPRLEKDGKWRVSNYLIRNDE
jgi:Protein of unknown function (DUF4019)